MHIEFIILWFALHIFNRDKDYSTLREKTGVGCLLEKNEIWRRNEEWQTFQTLA
jgi:hypothetical protein